MIATLLSLYVRREQRDELPFIRLSVWRIALQVFISYFFWLWEYWREIVTPRYLKCFCHNEDIILTRLASLISFCLVPVFHRFQTDSWRLLKSPCMSFTMPFPQPKIQTLLGKRPYTRWSVNWTATSPKSSRHLPVYRPKWRVVTVTEFEISHLPVLLYPFL